MFRNKKKSFIGTKEYFVVSVRNDGERVLPNLSEISVVNGARSRLQLQWRVLLTQEITLATNNSLYANIIPLSCLSFQLIHVFEYFKIMSEKKVLSHFCFFMIQLYSLFKTMSTRGVTLKLKTTGFHYREHSKKRFGGDGLMHVFDKMGFFQETQTFLYNWAHPVPREGPGNGTRRTEIGSKP